MGDLTSAYLKGMCMCHMPGGNIFGKSQIIIGTFQITKMLLLTLNEVVGGGHIKACYLFKC